MDGFRELCDVYFDRLLEYAQQLLNIYLDDKAKSTKELVESQVIP